MVSESFAALLLSEPNSLLVIMGPFPGVSHGCNSVWPKPSTQCSQTAPGKAAGRGWWLSLCAGALPSLTAVTPMWQPVTPGQAEEPSHHWLLWHWCGTHVVPCLSQPVTPGQAEVDHGTEAAFFPWVFAAGTKRFEVTWFSLVVPQEPGLPNKCWRLKQVLNYQLLLNFGTSAIISSRQRKLWVRVEFSVFSSFFIWNFLTWKFLSFSYLADVKCTCFLHETQKGTHISQLCN